MKRPFKRQERGNVFFIILVAIVLFAALMYAFASGGDGAKSNLSPSQAKITAAGMLSYAKQLESRVSTLIRRGCSETELSFNNRLMTHPTFWGEYNNSSTPIDKSCEVFQDDKTGLRFVMAPVGLDAGDVSADATDNRYYITSSYKVVDVGETTLGDLMLLVRMEFLENPGLELCRAINQSLGIDGVQGDDLNVSNTPDIYRFHGSYVDGAATGASVIGDVATNVTGRSTGCFQAVGFGSRYVFYHVLLAR